MRSAVWIRHCGMQSPSRSVNISCLYWKTLIGMHKCFEGQLIALNIELIGAHSKTGLFSVEAEPDAGG